MRIHLQQPTEFSGFSLGDASKAKDQAINVGHLSYCTNIHPGSDWSSVFGHLRRSIPKIKNSLSPTNAFGIGLRLSASAATTLANNVEQQQAFSDWLQELDAYVYTLNGFPFETFHGTRVKEKVYEPDWTTVQRLDYSKTLAVLLLSWLPKEEKIGSISTVPIGFKASILKNKTHNLELAVKNLLSYAQFAYELEQQHNKLMALALEPEPGCWLESLSDVQDFFEMYLFSASSIRAFAHKVSIPLGEAESWLRSCIGVCLDTCHASVMYEAPIDHFKTLKKNGIAIPKIQITAALEFDVGPDTISYLSKNFNDDCYLHQTNFMLNDHSVLKAIDIPEALDLFQQYHHHPRPLNHSSSSVQTLQSGRTHFHVPVFVDQVKPFKTTQQDVIDLLNDFEVYQYCPHFEVETYTFNVLPNVLQLSNVEDSIIRELVWVREQMTNYVKWV